MKASRDLSERVLEFSRTCFGEVEQGEGTMGHTWTGSTNSSPTTKARGETISPVSNVPVGAWGGWPNRGIPELASPLAD